MLSDDYEFYSCVCCMMGQQESNGFCRKCNDQGCEEEWR